MVYHTITCCALLSMDFVIQVCLVLSVVHEIDIPSIALLTLLITPTFPPTEYTHASIQHGPRTFYSWVEARH
jgi:hypothetical protein